MNAAEKRARTLRVKAILESCETDDQRRAVVDACLSLARDVRQCQEQTILRHAVALWAVDATPTSVDGSYYAAAAQKATDLLGAEVPARVVRYVGDWV